jgi:acyl-CoA synthetase (AMP-forming)/AMP-acid ligase II
VHAVVVLRQGESATLESIQSHCRERIAGYKIPRSVEFVDAAVVERRQGAQERAAQAPLEVALPAAMPQGSSFGVLGRRHPRGNLPVPIPQGVMKR